MFAQKSLISHLGRTAMIAGVAAIALTAVEPTSAVAAPAAKEKGLTAATGTSGATDFSARRRYYRGGGGGAAAAAAFAGIVGTGIAIAASSAAYYYDSYGYYGGPPVAYYDSPGYGYGYGGNPYYYQRRPLCMAATTPGSTGNRPPAGNQNNRICSAGRCGRRKISLLQPYVNSLWNRFV